MLWNRVLTKDEIKNLVNTIPQENLKLHYEFENGQPIDLSENDYDGISYLTKSGEEDIKISHGPIPHRRPGRMFCLPHKDEGSDKR